MKLSHKPWWLGFLLYFFLAGGMNIYAQEKETTRSIQRKITQNWKNYEPEKVQEVIKEVENELKSISERKQMLEINKLSRSLRHNLRNVLEEGPEKVNEGESSKNAGALESGDMSESDETMEIIDTEDSPGLALLELQEAEKKAEIDNLTKVLELQAKSLQVQQLTIYGGAAIFLFLTLFSINLYRANNRNKKTNLLLEEEKVKTEIERDKSEALLLNILPKSVAEELKTKGEAAVKQYDTASVLFTDFKGFTTFAEKMTPVELVSELEKCFTGFDEIVAKYGLEKIKTIGDAYMCVGGIPEANKRNSLDMVLAGLAIQKFMEDKKEKRSKEGKDFWDLRLGINSGELIAGVIGKSKFAYDVWGDTVNTASRMESSGEIGKVNISGKTYEIVQDFFECTYRGKVNAKNKGEIDMYFVQRVKPDLSQDALGLEPNEAFWQLAQEKGLMA